MTTYTINTNDGEVTLRAHQQRDGRWTLKNTRTGEDLGVRAETQEELDRDTRTVYSPSNYDLRVTP